jgi:hypothetical protein
VASWLVASCSLLWTPADRLVNTAILQVSPRSGFRLNPCPSDPQTHVTSQFLQRLFGSALSFHNCTLPSLRLIVPSLSLSTRLLCRLALQHTSAVCPLRPKRLPLPYLVCIPYRLKKRHVADSMQLQTTSGAKMILASPDCWTGCRAPKSHPTS